MVLFAPVLSRELACRRNNGCFAFTVYSQA